MPRGRAADPRIEMADDIPAHVWGAVEIKHANHGLEKAEQ
jgi:hypothetical protein